MITHPMNIHSLLNSAVSVIISVALSGCASVISGSHQNVKINSHPSGARVTVARGDGHQVATLTTPGVANLKRSSGYFNGANYAATIEKPGYRSQTVQITSTANPWMFGNIFIGGLIGLLIVDPLTGAM